ncbi:hypothetical protein CEE61_04090 [Stenotrophomonas maltophilia]|nr:hypothetical protein CEE61_04090 [Stenotrophomonas maltophilia]
MIRAEFGGGYPIYADQYYRGRGLVPDVPANYGVPTSGPIYASQFYNAVKATPSAQLRRWTKGRVKGVLTDLPGLIDRREAEVKLWNSK